jgi:predicted nuclease of predicted toxin-antitoxin system
MFLLIDECCSKGLVGVAEKLGHAAQLTREVRSLGKQASDADIHAFAKRNEAIVVTANAVDFMDLAGAGKGHPGMILLPSTPAKKAAALFKKVLPVAEKVFASQQSMFVEIDEDGTITSFQLPDAT